MKRATAPFSLLLLITVLSGLTNRAQNSRTTIDHYFNQVSQLGQLNGNILLANEGDIAYQGSFGYADMLSGIANQINSRFNLASISKVITATAILQLKEKGKLSMDDKIDKWLAIAERQRPEGSCYPDVSAIY